MNVYRIFAMMAVLFLSVNYVNAQTIRTVLRTGQPMCFPENGRPCGKRPPDFRYGVVQSSDEPDWFTVSTESPIRTNMIGLGAYSWEENPKLPNLEPYPIGPREQKVEFSPEEIAKPEEGISSSGRPLIKPAKILETNSQVVKAVEGHMYLLRVRDDIHDFYVLMRVDKIIPGKSVTITWRWFASP